MMTDVDVEYGHQSHQPRAEPPAQTDHDNQHFLAKYRRRIANAMAVLALLIALTVPISLILKNKNKGGSNEASTAAAAASGTAKVEDGAAVTDVVVVVDGSVDDVESNITSLLNSPALLFWDSETTVAAVTQSPTPTPTPTPLPSFATPTFNPTPMSSVRPTTMPSNASSSTPSMSPTVSPSLQPSTPPSLEPTTRTPTSAPTTTFFFEYLSITNDDLGIEMSAGLSVRLIATSEKQVEFSNGEKSKLKYHTMTDGAGIIELDNGSYAYVVNSEESDDKGGVYALYFDAKGNVYDYRLLLKGTSRNCSGGLTPWKTYVSCEEYGLGQCHQIDPNPNSEHFDKPQVTLLGAREGGRYESVAVDNRKPDKPVFFVTEDHEYGAMRRFVANGQGWDALHQDGDTTFLYIKDDNTFEWTTNQVDAMVSAKKYYTKSEGVSFYEGKLYFMAKAERKMLILDLDQMTYETEISGKKFYGGGEFTSQPDQIMVGPSRKFLFFTEDGGDSPGVYVRFSGDEMYSAMFQGIPGVIYSDDETVGIALSPDNLRFYAGFQDAGVILEFTRDDGLPFQ